MKASLRSIPLLLARTGAVVLGLAVLGYLVYCAHEGAQVREEPKLEPYLPSSKAIIPPPMTDGRKPSREEMLRKPKKKKGPQHQQQKPGPDDVFIPSSKSGVLRLIPTPFFESEHSG